VVIDTSAGELDEGMPLDGEYEPSPLRGVRDHVDLYERSGGTEGNLMHGRPIVVITSVGARSGKLRKNPVMRVEHDGRYAVVASKGGADDHPTWYYNLLAHPEVEVQDGPTKRDMTARLATGTEKAEWWARAVEAFPDYAAYQQKTTREIPLFVLEPVAG
jgi:deazaflavin-dependent oxidoreductase (nitroreductase family)